MIIKLINLLFLFCLVTAAQLIAAEPDKVMEQANQAYINETYHEAIELYESILEMDVESASLYYNLGNAYYKTGQIGKAILNYERARRLSPNDEAILHNLGIARSLLTENIEAMPQLFFLDWRDKFVQMQSVDGWAITIIILAFSLMLCAVLFFVLKSRTQKKVFFFAGALSLLFLLASYYAVNQQHYMQYIKQEAIVMSPRVTAKSAPSDRSIDLFIAYEGTKVELTSNVMDWYEVRLPNGQVGWINKSALEII